MILILLLASPVSLCWISANLCLSLWSVCKFLQYPCFILRALNDSVLSQKEIFLHSYTPLNFMNFIPNQVCLEIAYFLLLCVFLPMPNKSFWAEQNISYFFFLFTYFCLITCRIAVLIIKINHQCISCAHRNYAILLAILFFPRTSMDLWNNL